MSTVEEANARWNAFVTDVTTRLTLLERRVTKIESAPQDQMNRIEIDSLRLKVDQFKTWLLRWAADTEMQLGLKAARLGPVPWEDQSVQEPSPPPVANQHPAAPRKASPPTLDVPVKRSRLTTKAVAVICSVVIGLGVVAGMAIVLHWIPGLP